jgi:hypothetical protein
MKGVLPWLVHWACRASTRDFSSVLAAGVGLVQNIFLCTRELYYVTFRFLYIFTMYLWMGEEGGEGGLERWGTVSLLTVLTGTVNILTVPASAVNIFPHSTLF